VNQMGANLAEIRPEWRWLWVLAFLYFCAAALVAHLRRARGPDRVPAV